MNPSSFRSKPFVTELSKLCDSFNRNDLYGVGRCDFASLISSLSFTTYNATDDEPNVIVYTFILPELIGVHHENGEYKLVYEWKEHRRDDLTDKFFNAELEKKYINKDKKHIKLETDIVDVNDTKWFNSKEKIINCHLCGKKINTFSDGFMTDKIGNPICAECYAKYLLDSDL